MVTGKAVLVSVADVEKEGVCDGVGVRVAVVVAVAVSDAVVVLDMVFDCEARRDHVAVRLELLDDEKLMLGDCDGVRVCEGVGVRVPVLLTVCVCDSHTTLPTAGATAVACVPPR